MFLEMKIRAGRLERRGQWALHMALRALALCPLLLQGAEATKVELHLNTTQSHPGETVWAGLHFTLAEGWHTYWRYGGDAAQPPQVHWELPEGVVAGEIHWPAPEKQEKEGFYSYIYSEEVMLLVPLSIAASAASGENLTIGARVKWLECKEICVPQETSVKAALAIGASSQWSASADFIEHWRAKVPRVEAALSIKTEWDGEGEENERRFRALPGAGEEWALQDFYPHEYEDFVVTGETLAYREGIEKMVIKDKGKPWPKAIAGLAAIRTAEGKAELVETVLFFAGDLEEPPAESAVPAASPPAGRIFLMLWFAFIGGFILNFMPCVLPVIALKILGFVNQSEASPAKVKRLGLLYAVGVVVSFVVLAGLVIGVQQAGRLASWGMQFQSVEFLVLMMILMTLVALNFFGVFEVGLGGKAMGAAGQLSGKSGSSGAFFNGVLATVLATPCTAPFLAPALGVAFAQPPALILLFFVTIALGLAFPYVALSWNPRLLTYLPKPGPWMGRFKAAMGFPMMAAAVWLYSIALHHFSPEVEAGLWLGILLVLIALSVWVWGQFVQQSVVLRPLSAGIALLLGAGGGIWILEGELQWRSPVAAAETSNGSIVEKGIEWRPWSQAAVEEARAAGHPVLVDFTANWCLACLANKRLGIAVSSVRKKLKEISAVTFRADYTVRDPRITDELQRYGRAGVPLVLVFAPEAEIPAQVLPTVLTPQIVLDALDWAANGREMASK